MRIIYNDELLEPIKGYNTVYKDKLVENARALFDKQVEESKMNVDENRKVSAQYRSEASQAEILRKKLRKLKTIRVLLIIAAIISLIVGIVGITNKDALMIIISLSIFVISLIIIFSVLNKKIKLLKKAYEDKSKSADELLRLANQLIEPLINLFDSESTRFLIQQTVPTLVIDKKFDMKRFDYLNGKYGLPEENDAETSTVGVLSGEINGNPYLFERTLHHYMGMQTYTGTLTISWTTYHRDSKGNTVSRTHTQVLRAHVIKPKPFFEYTTSLVYGNDAAPDLTFSHVKTHAENWSERQLESKVKSRLKKIRKKAVKNIGQGFTEMGNEEFDAIFGAYDRDNEVQFRLLFTPLAQKNMLDLMKGGSPFGDDFNFYKSKCLNYVISEHAQKWSMDTDPSHYTSYDVDICKNLFVEFNAKYFESFYFDMAPLLSIPLYQQIKPKEYIYREEYCRNYTAREAEVLANRLGGRVFAHPATKTNTIIKTHLLSKDDDVDVLGVSAFSYRTVHRVDFIPVRGGDGRIHAVPVPWIQYVPLMKETEMSLKAVDMADKDFRARGGFSGGDNTFYHDIIATVGNKEILTDDSPDEIDDDNVDYSDIVEQIAEKLENIDEDIDDIDDDIV